MALSPEFALLLDLGLAIFAALGFSFLFSRLKQPAVVGQLLAGMLIGPFGLGLIQDLSTINLLASLGIILLLFTVGLELDPLEIRRIAPESFVFAAVELTVSFGSAFTISVLVGLGYLESVFVAMVVATTSTAIMGKLLLESKSLRARESHMILTASIVEDFATILILLLLPGLVVASSQVPISELGLFALKGLLLLAVIFAFGWKAAPGIIDRVSRRSEDYREAAFLLTLSFGFAFALLSSYLGFSPAVGAFLVGLIIRGRQAEFVKEKVGPIKDLFIVLFFVSMGTLINITTVLTVTLPIIAIISTALLGKFWGSWAGAKLSTVRKEATKVGVSMLPRGEFSFIVAREGTALGVAATILFPIAGLATLISSIASSLGFRLLKSQDTSLPASSPPVPADIERFNK